MQLGCHSWSETDAFLGQGSAKPFDYSVILSAAKGFALADTILRFAQDDRK